MNSPFDYEIQKGWMTSWKEYQRRVTQFSEESNQGIRWTPSGFRRTLEKGNSYNQKYLFNENQPDIQENKGKYFLTSAGYILDQNP